MSEIIKLCECFYKAGNFTVAKLEKHDDEPTLFFDSNVFEITNKETLSYEDALKLSTILVRLSVDGYGKTPKSIPDALEIITQHAALQALSGEERGAVIEKYASGVANYISGYTPLLRGQIFLAIQDRFENAVALNAFVDKDPRFTFDPQAMINHARDIMNPEYKAA